MESVGAFVFCDFGGPANFVRQIVSCWLDSQSAPIFGTYTYLTLLGSVVQNLGEIEIPLNLNEVW